MLLNTNLVLIKGVIATYLNRKLETPMASVLHSVDESIEAGVGKNQAMGDAGEGEVIDSLKSTLNWLRETPPDVEVSPKDLESTIKINVGFDSDYTTAVMDTIGDVIKSTDSETDIPKKINGILSELNYFSKKKRIKKKLLAAAREIDVIDGNDSLDTYMKTTTNDLDGETQQKDQMPAGYVGSLSTEDEESVEKVLDSTKELNSDEGCLTIPLGGLHEGLGKVDVRRGDLVCVKARSNNYKSGALLDFTKWIPMSNVPYMLPTKDGKPSKKKPLILRISFENTPEQDALTLYKSMYELKHQKKIDVSKIDSKKAAKELIKDLRVNGYEVAIVCFDPNKFDVWKLIDIMTKYELDGYEIHACICDYLEIVAKAMKNQRPDSAIASAFEVVRNHCMPRRIAFITAHQLNTASGDVLAEVGSAAFPKKMAQAGGIYDHNCRSLIQKLDIEINLHIHKQDDVSYLGFGIGKLRERLASESKKYFYYKFHTYGGIVPDKPGENNAIYSLSSVGGTSEDNNVEW